MEKVEFEKFVYSIGFKKPGRNPFFLSKKKNMKKERKGANGFRPCFLLVVGWGDDSNVYKESTECTRCAAKVVKAG